MNDVTFKAGVKPHLLRSRSDVESARRRGEVTVAATATVVNCPVLGFGQKRVAGFSAGKTIHYYDLGPVKVAPGNAVLPLVAITQRGRRASTTSPKETIAPGATDYPPLWGIVNGTWTASAHRRLLTSYAQVAQRAEGGRAEAREHDARRELPARSLTREPAEGARPFRAPSAAPSTTRPTGALMSRIRPVSSETATPEEAQALDAIRAAWGAVPELGRVIARSEPLTRALLAFDRELGRGRFTGAFAEQLDIAVANENRCPYCLAAHTAAGRALGLDNRTLADARVGRGSDPNRPPR